MECACGQPAIVKVSNSANNPGRQFWTCASRNCKFFKWASDPVPPQTLSGRHIPPIVARGRAEFFEPTPSGVMWKPSGYSDAQDDHNNCLPPVQTVLPTPPMPIPQGKRQREEDEVSDNEPPCKRQRPDDESTLCKCLVRTTAAVAELFVKLDGQWRRMDRLLSDMTEIKEEIKALFFKIDTNSDKTCDATEPIIS